MEIIKGDYLSKASMQSESLYDEGQGRLRNHKAKTPPQSKLKCFLPRPSREDFGDVTGAALGWKTSLGTALVFGVVSLAMVDRTGEKYINHFWVNFIRGHFSF